MNLVKFHCGSSTPQNMNDSDLYFTKEGRLYYNNHLIGENLDNLTIGEGTTIGINSIAGGTTDKDMISGLLGGLTSSVVQLHPSEAKGALSIALGADNVANTGGSVAMGYDNLSGGKGYYFSAIDATNKTITLSTKQTSASAPSNPSWKKGDRLFIVNDNRYWLEIAADTTSNIISVVELPEGCTKVNYSITDLLTLKPNDKTIINVDRPESGVVDIGWGAIGIGTQNIVVGSNAYTVGYKNNIVGDFGVAFGQENLVGYSAFATGVGNQAKGKASVALGDHTEAIGNCSIALGGYTKATGYGSFAVGDKSKATGGQSVAMGNESSASGQFSIAGGNHATASKYAAIALGSYVNATGEHSVSIGQGSTASGDYSVALGGSNQAKGKYSFAEGNSTIAKGISSHAEGGSTIAEDAWTHTEGYGTVAGLEGVPKLMNLEVSDARASHAEGTGTHAKGPASHAEGIGTIASGKASHTEGNKTQATTIGAHAEGNSTIAKGNYSHTEGSECETADGAVASHAGGYKSVAGSVGSFVHGRYLKSNAEYQAVFGKYNAVSTDALFIIGNGTAEDNRSNAFEIISDDDKAVSIKIGNTILSEEALQKDYLRRFNEYKDFESSELKDSYQGQYLFDTSTARPFYIAYYDKEFPKDSICKWLLDSECCPVIYIGCYASGAYSLYDLLPNDSIWEGKISDLSLSLTNIVKQIGNYASKMLKDLQLQNIKYLLPTIYLIFKTTDNKINRLEILNLKNLQRCDSAGYVPSSAGMREDGTSGWSFTVETNRLTGSGLMSANVTFNLSDFSIFSDTNIRIIIN